MDDAPQIRLTTPSPQEALYKEIRGKANSPPQYRALDLLARIYRVMAYVVGLVGAVWVAMLLGNADTGAELLGIGWAVVCIFVGVISCVGFSQGIRLLLKLEERSRLAEANLSRVLSTLETPARESDNLLAAEIKQEKG